MTISSALNAGVAGLNAHASRLATISDNISNSGTYGYKRATTEFETMVLTKEANAARYYAGGVRTQSGRLIGEEGPLVSTSNGLDLAIAGRGMLPVIPATRVSGGEGDGSMLLTRTGDFRVDENGVLKTSTGLVLLGWPADASGNIAAQPRDSAAGLKPVVIVPEQKAGDPTTAITLGVNLPATATNPGAPGTALPLSVEYFGNLGSSESLNITFTPAPGSTSASNTWNMVIRDSAGGGAVVGEYLLTFDDSRTSGGTLASVSMVSGGAYNAAEGSVEIQTEGGPIVLVVGKPGDTSAMTQLSDAFAPTGVKKNGSGVGTLTDVAIDEKGILRATYSSGASRALYQIPLVDVPNINGLKSANGPVFEVSSTSGDFYLRDSGTGAAGTIEGYAREGSATDMAAELTSLIQTQRAYSSNAKVIQTVDEMLQETTNIKR